MNTAIAEFDKEERKICLVCGDKALGHNFNVITCESCKAFFRRNALKKKVFHCRFSDNCDITISNRRYCRKCRLKKCFRVGMMPELITIKSEAEIDYYQKVQNNRKRTSIDASLDRSPKLFASSSNSPEDQLCRPISVDRKSFPICEYGNIQKLDVSMKSDQLINIPKSLLMQLMNLYYSQSTIKIDPSSPNYNTCDFLSISDQSDINSAGISETESENNYIIEEEKMENEEIIESSLELIAIDFNSTIEFPPDFDAWKLFRLEELLTANETMTYSRKIIGPIVSYIDSLSECTEMMNFAIRRMANMLKLINVFIDLSIQDRCTLFTGAIRELMCIRGLMCYEPSANSYRPIGYPHRYLRLGAVRGRKDGHLALKNFYDSFQMKWRTSDPIMLCLSSIIIFDPNRPNLIDITSVKVQNQFYQDLLKCYLRSTYGRKDGERIFGILMDRVRMLKQLLRYTAPFKIHVELDNDMEPLFIEILPIH